MYQYAYLPYRAELIKFQSSPRAAMYDLALFRINTLHHSKWEKKPKQVISNSHLKIYCLLIQQLFSQALWISSASHISPSFFYLTSQTKQNIHKNQNRATIVFVARVSMYLHIKQAPLPHHLTGISSENLKYNSNYSFFDLSDVTLERIYSFKCNHNCWEKIWSCISQRGKRNLNLKLYWNATAFRNTVFLSNYPF